MYETGAGYNWKKIDDVKITPQDIVIEPIDLGLAQDLIKEGIQMHRLTVLAQALEVLGEADSAALVRVLTDPRLVSEAEENWVNKFFSANQQLLDRAKQFAQAKGINFGQYLGQLGRLSESIGRKTVHEQLGYVNMPWSPPGKSSVTPTTKPGTPAKSTPKSEQKIRPDTELRWPFPPPDVLQDERAFIPAAIAWAMNDGQDMYARMYGPSSGLQDAGKKGEIQASRAYLRYLMKDTAPRLAATLQAKWQKASEKGDAEEQQTLRTWWTSLSDVWELLQRMIGIINGYERER